MARTNVCIAAVVADAITMLAEDQENPLLRPTRENIESSFEWLMGDLSRGDSLFFYFAGAHCLTAPRQQPAAWWHAFHVMACQHLQARAAPIPRPQATAARRRMPRGGAIRPSARWTTRPPATLLTCT